MLVLADRVQETSTSPGGTGTLNLSGTAPAGFKTFSLGIGTGNTTYYCIFDTVAYDWETGIGTYTSGSPGTLSRTTVLSNSAGTTSAINFTNGNTLNIFVTYPSEKSINYDENGVATIGSTLGYSDTGIIGSFASTVAGYNQVIIQNKSTATNASANINVSNDAGSSTANYAEFGINSSTFTGSGSFNIAGAAYVASSSTDLVFGTYGAYPIHFLTSGSTTDSMTINTDGSISLGGLPSSGIGNIACNNINLKFQSVATSGGTTTLTNASPYYTQFTGTSNQTVAMPNATTCLVGTTFILDNDSTGTLTIKDGAGTSFETIISGGVHNFILESNATVAGTWVRYSSVPSTVEWGTNSLQLGSTVITGGTWNGGTIQVGYGGTGLTSLTSGGALYATSSSTMTSGTLPVTAGGTGQTSFSSGYIPYGNSSAALQSSNLLQFNGSYLQVGGGSVLGGATNPIAAFSQSANNYVQTYTYNPNTGISGSADFVAYTNNSTDAHGWADMGFTSSTYADAVYTVTGPNEAYLLGSAPSGAGATGNLVYATDSTGTANAHQWYVGGFTQAKGAWKMQLTSTGLQLADNPIFSGGTANGVLYLNGSKAVTSGTALTFDGSLFVAPRVMASTSGYTVDSANTQLGIYSGKGYVQAPIGGTLEIWDNKTNTVAAFTQGYTAFYSGVGSTSERMRLDSSGNLGIGTSSPATKIQVSGASAPILRVTDTRNTVNIDIQPANTVAYFGTSSNHNLAFQTNGTQVATLDTSGNLGLGVTPSAWGSGWKAFQAGAYGQGYAAHPSLPISYLTSNAYYNGTNWIYSTSAYANYLAVSAQNGQFQWLTAPSGTAGNAITFTQAMTLDASGNLGIGTSSPQRKLHIDGGASTTYFQMSNTASGSTNADGFQIAQDGANVDLINREAGYMAFDTSNTERMRIDSSGNVGIGTSTPGARLTCQISTPSAASNTSYFSGTDGTKTNALTQTGSSYSYSGVGANELWWYLNSTYSAVTLGSDGAVPIKFVYSGAERARVQQGFSVGTTADPGAGGIYATGSITANYSDDRLKTKLGGIENALDKVKSLSGFYYEANQTAQDLGYQPVREVGVSAQQVQAVLPEVVKPAPIDQQYLTVQYERIIPLLIEAIKELEAQVAELRK